MFDSRSARFLAGSHSLDLGLRLDSWKAIADYLGRHVTSVQRWEREEGLQSGHCAHFETLNFEF
jgi:hypothetical protein